MGQKSCSRCNVNFDVAFQTNKLAPLINKHTNVLFKIHKIHTHKLLVAR